MAGLLSNIDPKGHLEYSVVYTDRSLNHMSESFQEVMKDISKSLKKVYNAEAVAVVPGSGTFGMEAVARQFATNKKCMVIRNGFFSYRWTQIFEMGNIPSKSNVLKARPTEEGKQAPYAPAPLEEVIADIKSFRPDVVFAPHVETSAGMMLPDSYIRAVSDAVHEVGGLFVLDCIASGTIWVDMKECGVDVLISAPQKGWSASPCCALVMLGSKGKEKLNSTTSTSFSCDLKKWHQIMEAYEKGGHAYHATMPTDSLKTFRNAMNEAIDYGLSKVKNDQEVLGQKIRDLLESKGIKSLAAKGFQSPGVIVSYTDDPGVKTGKKFLEHDIQIAAGVPLKCDEPVDFQTFRIGLFGLDKLKNIDRTVSNISEAFDQVLGNLH
ncbi:MAG: aminotransferase [Halobacteriovoraceae bacterium]|nr:aminotransferase [Halobacteriovoraceae bacterium]